MERVRELQTDRDRDRQTASQTEKERVGERQTDRDKEEIRVTTNEEWDDWMRQDVTILSAFSIWKPRLATVRGSPWYSADVVIVGCVCNKDTAIFLPCMQKPITIPCMQKPVTIPCMQKPVTISCRSKPCSHRLMQAKTSHQLIQAKTSHHHILTKTSRLSYRQKIVTSHTGKKQSTLIGKLYNLVVADSDYTLGAG